MGLIAKVLSYAAKRKLIAAVPEFPTVTKRQGAGLVYDAGIQARMECSKALCWAAHGGS